MKRNHSGYEIKQLFATLFSFFYDASYGTIYPTLKKCEANGLITKETILQEGKPSKHEYSITESGKEAFEQYLKSPIAKSVMRSDILMRLYFGEYAEPAVIRSWLELSVEQNALELEEVRQCKLERGRYMSPTQQLCIQVGITNLENNLKLAKEALEQLSYIDQSEKESKQ
ncbi:PadR family transcriptional regulator [Paenibacillus sp. KN14-4R]|uniref:PadR family transcriptional regulator n=1 Tax=Paenibacillus sp. KN14-4R TaxID=3445773 RepID=UPI003FA05D27